MQPMRILTHDIRYEQDLVTARKRARIIAAGLGFDLHEQTRISTAVSEIVRNAFRYAGGGAIAFEVSGSGPQSLVITVRDHGRGIADAELVMSGRYVSTTGMGIGLLGARRLMDDFELTTGAGGTTVRMGKAIPAGYQVEGPELARLAAEIQRESTGTPLEELQAQNQELVRAMEEIQRRQTEIERLNDELKETNRGVLALNAELEDKAESLRTVSEAKSRFLSHISHEFRTPLNSIRNLARILASRMDGQLTPEQERQVLFIQGSADTLVEMVNDLLDLAKIEAGKSDLQPSTFTISDLFGTMRGMFRPLMTSDAVELVIADPGSIPPLHTDESKLSQILRNFISNAVKYTERGRIEVSAVPVAGDRIRISVADSGIGIAPENIDRIFEEFVQIPNPLQTRSKGTGLGLSLSNRLAQLLGGTIEVKSAQGEGSIFTVVIPRVAPQAEAAAIPAAPAGEAQRRVSVLLVDDLEADRYALRALLPRDCEVIEASDGTEALEMIARLRPDVVFLDLAMPGLGGMDVLERLAAGSEPMPRIVVHTSRILLPAEEARLRELGAVEIMSKGYGDVAATRMQLARLIHGGAEKDVAP